MKPNFFLSRTQGVEEHTFFVVTYGVNALFGFISTTQEKETIKKI